MMNAKIAVNHEIMGRVSLKNPTHLPIHHVPLAVFKVCTVNIRHRMLLKFRLRLEFVKPRTMIAQMVPYGSIHCTKKTQPLQKHDSFLGITPCFFAATIKTMLPTNHEQIDSKFSQIWQILTQKNIKDRITPQINFFQWSPSRCGNEMGTAGRKGDGARQVGWKSCVTVSCV